MVFSPAQINVIKESDNIKVFHYYELKNYVCKQVKTIKISKRIDQRIRQLNDNPVGHILKWTQKLEKEFKAFLFFDLEYLAPCNMMNDAGLIDNFIEKEEMEAILNGTSYLLLEWRR